MKTTPSQWIDALAPARRLIAAPLLLAAGIGLGVAAAPVAAAQDPCAVGVSSSRCLGPQDASQTRTSTGFGSQNGPYGPWGSVPPLG